MDGLRAPAGNGPCVPVCRGRPMKDGLTEYQAKYYAHELQRSYASDHVGKLAGLLFDAQVEPKPHQIDAALFALQTPFLKGVILADEVGLGKTIEAGIVISQYWAERKRRILIIAPSSLRQQWQQELYEKFLIPSSLLDAKTKDRLHGAGMPPEVLICSYEFAQRHEMSLLRAWDVVVADEAHRLRNFWKGKAKVANAVARIVDGAHKTILLTATPLQNKLEELYGLVAVFDPSTSTRLTRSASDTSRTASPQPSMTLATASRRSASAPFDATPTDTSASPSVCPSRSALSRRRMSSASAGS